MKQDDFIERNSEKWRLFEEIIANEEKTNSHDIPKLYRQICHDLASAKAREYSPDLVKRINNLLLSGQTTLYKPHNKIVSGIVEFFTLSFKRSLLDIRAYVIWAHVLFYGFAFISAIVVLLFPAQVSLFVDSDTLLSIETMYDPSSEHFLQERPADSDFEMFGHYILNNISIAFQCFAGGLLLGIGTLFYLMHNAVFFGAISAYIVNIEYGSTFFSFIITHGSFELSAIVLSGAAGGVIGKHLIAPGQYSRADSLKMAGKRTFPVILGCFILLVLAAFVEAFWSSSRIIPNEIKYIVGSLCWIWVLVFVFKRGKYATQ
jgi:uncharacterized membrane protein SpoIIM required for sporulation